MVYDDGIKPATQGNGLWVPSASGLGGSLFRRLRTYYRERYSFYIGINPQQVFAAKRAIWECQMNPAPVSNTGASRLMESNPTLPELPSDSLGKFLGDAHYNMVATL